MTVPLWYFQMYPSELPSRLYRGYTERINSLAPGRPGCHFKTAIFNLVLLIGIFTLSKDNALIWMPRDLTDDKSTLVEVMAWCHQTTSHYLSQCWPRSLSPCGVTRPQWVKVVCFVMVIKSDNKAIQFITSLWWEMSIFKDSHINSLKQEHIWDM